MVPATACLSGVIELDCSEQPPYLFKDSMVLLDQGNIMEEASDKVRLDLTNCLPLGWAKIGMEGKSNLEEKVSC